LKNLYFSTKKQKWQNRDRFMSVTPVAEILPNGMENVQAVGFMAVYRNKSLILPQQVAQIAAYDPLPKILTPPKPVLLSNFPKFVTMIKPVICLVMGN
jgi:hypothetical protein